MFVIFKDISIGPNPTQHVDAVSMSVNVDISLNFRISESIIVIYYVSILGYLKKKA